MNIAAIETLPQGSDAAVPIYRCDECQREMRLPSGRRPLCRQMAAFSPKLELTPTHSRSWLVCAAGSTASRLVAAATAPSQRGAYCLRLLTDSRASRCSVNSRRLDSKTDSTCTAWNVEAPAARRPAIRLFCSATTFCASHTRRWARARGSSSATTLARACARYIAWPSHLGSARDCSRV